MSENCSSLGYPWQLESETSMLKSPITTMFSYLFMAKSINLVSSLRKKIYAFTRRPIDVKDGPFSFHNKVGDHQNQQSTYY